MSAPGHRWQPETLVWVQESCSGVGSWPLVCSWPQQQWHREEGSALPQQSKATVHLLDGYAANRELQAPPSSLAFSCYGQTAFLTGFLLILTGFNWEYAKLHHLLTYMKLLTAEAVILVTQFQISLCPSLDVLSEH